MQIQTYEVIVEFKKEVLDAQGRAIGESISRLGYKDLMGVKVSRRFLIDLKASAESDRLASEIAQSFLANPVSEIYTIRKL